MAIAFEYFVLFIGKFAQLVFVPLWAFHFMKLCATALLTPKIQARHVHT